MEVSCGPRKRKRASDDDADIQIPASSSNARVITGNVQLAQLPQLVVEKIFKNLDLEDLLVCSSVNKLWNHEARRLLREKHQCALTIDLDRISAKEILEFKATLAVAQLPLPYGSLSIKMKIQKMPLRSWSKEVERAQDAIKDINLRTGTSEAVERASNAIEGIILRTGTSKVVQLDIKCDSKASFEACVISTVMAAVQNTVKILKINNLDGMELFGYFRGLPQLTQLEIDKEATISPSDVMHIKNFVQNSVTLESVGCMSPKWLHVLDKLPRTRKLALMKEFTCANMGRYRVVAQEFAGLEPKLEKLIIPRRLKQRLDVTTSKSLLVSSQASLIEIEATFEMLQAIHREQPLVSFANVRYLTVDLPLGMETEGLGRNDTITALCPKLYKLKTNTDYANLRNSCLAHSRSLGGLSRHRRYI